MTVHVHYSWNKLVQTPVLCGICLSRRVGSYLWQTVVYAPYLARKGSRCRSCTALCRKEPVVCVLCHSMGSTVTEVARNGRLFSVSAGWGDCGRTVHFQRFCRLRSVYRTSADGMGFIAPGAFPQDSPLAENARVRVGKKMDKTRNVVRTLDPCLKQYEGQYWGGVVTPVTMGCLGCRRWEKVFLRE